MNKSDKVYFSTAFFITLFSLAYCSVKWFSISLPNYYPQLHLWKMGKTAGVPSQGWYAMLVFGLVVSFILTYCANFVFPIVWKSSEKLSKGWVLFMGLGSASIVTLCLINILIHEFSAWQVF